MQTVTEVADHSVLEARISLEAARGQSVRKTRPEGLNPPCPFG